MVILYLVHSLEHAGRESHFSLPNTFPSLFQPDTVTHSGSSASGGGHIEDTFWM